MRQSLRIGNEPDFQKIIIASAVLHILFIALATIPLKTRDREYKSYVVNIVSPSDIRRTAKKSASAKTSKDKIPVKMKTPPRKRVRTPPKADMSLKTEKVVAKKIDTLRNKEKLRAIEKLRALSALSKKKEAKEQETDKELADLRQEIQGSVSVQTGVPGSQSSSSMNDYAALIRERIWSEWIYPNLDSQDLEVIIAFVINKDGKVISPRLVKTSGNTLYDRSAMKAIQKASPLPAPVVEEEFEVRFRL
jgi:colicin import membrane protein